MDIKKCKECSHSKIVISDNGYHSVCCLTQKAAIDCMTGKKDKFVTMNKDRYEVQRIY